MDSHRGTGRTTRQLMDAPINAVFICGGSCELGYVTNLAVRLERGDIRVETPRYFEYAWQGMRRPVVIDHAAYPLFTSRQATGMRECKVYLSSNGISCG